VQRLAHRDRGLGVVHEVLRATVDDRVEIGAVRVRGVGDDAVDETVERGREVDESVAFVVLGIVAQDRAQLALHFGEARLQRVVEIVAVRAATRGVVVGIHGRPIGTRPVPG